MSRRRRIRLIHPRYVSQACLLRLLKTTRHFLRNHLFACVHDTTHSLSIYLTRVCVTSVSNDKILCPEMFVCMHTPYDTAIMHNTTHLHSICLTEAWWTLRSMVLLRLVGFLKLVVSFAKEPYKRTIFCKRDLYFQGTYGP